MLILQGVNYAHPNRDILLSGIELVVNRHDKAAIVGNNGTGKSTLLRLMAGFLHPSGGTIKADAYPYYVPQHFGQYDDMTVAEALSIDHKLRALHEILAGNVTDRNMLVLDDDWTIEERCNEALANWGLNDIKLNRPMAALSGGQKTRVFLAGISVHSPEIVLLDEPSNHLDASGRSMLYNYITSTNNTLVVVSHDRTLLNLIDKVFELSPHGITAYGGNYEFYFEQKAIEQEAFNAGLKSKEKELRKAREIERETMERQQKLDARGRKKQEKSGVATIMLNTLRNNAEKSTAKSKGVHEEKIKGISDEVAGMRKQLPGSDKMKLDFDGSNLHKGKTLVTAAAVNMIFYNTELWQQPLSFILTSGQRLAIKGNNGSGKTTLVKLLLGPLKPHGGNIERADFSSIYIDQDYSVISNQLTVFEQAQLFNTANLEEHEVKSKLTHFLFTKEYWDKPCSALSGGEKMRLVLCCLTLRTEAPDVMILDEPTNNLDLQNVEILTDAISDYKGTLIVISHDEYFLQQVGIQKFITLSTAIKP